MGADRPDSGVTMAGDPPSLQPPAAGATCPQCQAPVEANQVICMGCGNRLKFEDSRAEEQESQDPWEDSPDVVNTNKKKDIVSFLASVVGLAILMGIGLFLMAESSEIQKPTPREQFGWVIFIYSGLNTLVLALSLWIYFRVEVGPFKHGYLKGMTKCAAFNLVVSVGGYVFVYLVPEILNNNF